MLAAIPLKGLYSEKRQYDGGLLASCRVNCFVGLLLLTGVTDTPLCLPVGLRVVQRTNSNSHQPCWTSQMCSDPKSKNRTI
ncbi:hypothetical protein E2C01_043715 [Portunus trituberculatus]|uniref:Uncharacterized protein n=1 Tax=Portunus trituberculatus TaxID=210409 RepID=A0A5B7FQ71_PORTR|nr:hypothetical protein [Portunus trituberculatus]